MHLNDVLDQGVIQRGFGSRQAALLACIFAPAWIVLFRTEPAGWRCAGNALLWICMYRYNGGRWLQVWVASAHMSLACPAVAFVVSGGGVTTCSSASECAVSMILSADAGC